MQVMMRYRFGPGGAGRLAYERFAKWAPDEGIAHPPGSSRPIARAHFRKSKSDRPANMRRPRP